MDGSELDGCDVEVDGYRREDMCKREEKEVDKVEVEWEGFSGSVERK